MSKIHEIPVVVVGGRSIVSTPDGTTSSVVLALLSEIESKLETYACNGEESTIDLRCLIGMPHDVELLRKTLSVGEVSATINTFGSSSAQETAVPCVWWVSHRDFDGSRQGEFIQITEVPDLLRSDRLSIKKGLAELRVRSAQLDTPNPFPSM